MKKLFVLAVIVFSFFFVSSPAFACEPCANTLDLEETIKKADLIIVGQKVADGPRSDSGEGYGGSDWIEVNIIETLKGSAPSTKITVNSWDAMCPYGITVNDSHSYLMLLQKSMSSGESHQYDAVDSGCAEKSYLVENDQINLAGQTMSLETFASTHGLRAPKKVDNDLNKNNNGTQTTDSDNGNGQTTTTEDNDDTQIIDTTNTDNTDNATSQRQDATPYYIVIALVALAILILVLLKLVKGK